MHAVLPIIGVVAALAFFVAFVALAIFAGRFVIMSPFVYEAAIRRFEMEPMRPGSIVFTGSSSITFWTTLARDFAPLAVINRGFGGSVVSQVNHFARRILPPGLDPPAIVLDCGGNDLAWGRSVERVLADTERFVALAHELAPRARVYVLSQKLPPVRTLRHTRMRALNERLAARADACGFTLVDVTTIQFDERGRRRPGLYRFDGLHPSEAGYALIASVLKPILQGLH